MALRPQRPDLVDRMRRLEEQVRRLRTAKPPPAPAGGGGALPYAYFWLNNKRTAAEDPYHGVFWTGAGWIGFPWVRGANDPTGGPPPDFTFCDAADASIGNSGQDPKTRAIQVNQDGVYLCTVNIIGFPDVLADSVTHVPNNGLLRVGVTDELDWLENDSFEQGWSVDEANGVIEASIAGVRPIKAGGTFTPQLYIKTPGITFGTAYTQSRDPNRWLNWNGCGVTVARLA